MSSLPVPRVATQNVSEDFTTFGLVTGTALVSRYPIDASRRKKNKTNRKVARWEADNLTPKQKHVNFLSEHEALGRRKIERGPLRTCRVHRRQLHRGYPMRRKYPRAMLCALSFSVLRASWLRVCNLHAFCIAPGDFQICIRPFLIHPYLASFHHQTAKIEMRRTGNVVVDTQTRGRCWLFARLNIAYELIFIAIAIK